MSEEHVSINITDPAVNFDLNITQQQFLVECSDSGGQLNVDITTPATGINLDVNDTRFEICIPGTLLPTGAATHEHSPVTKTLTYDADKRIIRVQSTKTDKTLSYDPVLKCRLLGVTDAVKGWTKTLNYTDDCLSSVVVT